jgi:hypothetical protein
MHPNATVIPDTRAARAAENDHVLTTATQSVAEIIFTLAAIDGCTVRAGTATMTNWYRGTARDGTPSTALGNGFVYGSFGSEWMYDIRVAPYAVTQRPTAHRLMVAVSDFTHIGTRATPSGRTQEGSCYGFGWE